MFVAEAMEHSYRKMRTGDKSKKSVLILVILQSGDISTPTISGERKECFYSQNKSHCGMLASSLDRLQVKELPILPWTQGSKGWERPTQEA